MLSTDQYKTKNMTSYWCIDQCHLHRFTCTKFEVVCQYRSWGFIRATLMSNQGQWLKITYHCHLNGYTCTRSEIVSPNCCWDITKNSYFHVFNQGQRLRSWITVISIGTHLPSSKLFAHTILEILHERAIFLSFMNYVTLKWRLAFTFKLNLNTKISFISGKT